jgi:hypothetical protein
MSNLWLEIETLMLDGVPLNPVQGRRLAELTEIALTRLLEQRGTALRGMSGVDEKAKNPGPQTMHVPAHANEARWAEELAHSLYRALDRTF